MPDLGLEAGDRVEPCAALNDVGLVFELDTFPVDLLFWLPSCETYCHHRSPLFDSSIGITLQSISIDQMH